MVLCYIFLQIFLTYDLGKSGLLSSALIQPVRYAVLVEADEANLASHRCALKREECYNMSPDKCGYYLLKLSPNLTSVYFLKGYLQFQIWNAVIGPLYSATLRHAGQSHSEMDHLPAWFCNITQRSFGKCWFAELCRPFKCWHNFIAQHFKKSHHQFHQKCP